MANWFQQHAGKLAIGAAIAVAGGGATFVALDSHQGRLQLDQQAIDVSDKQVNQQTVDYYRRVCSVMSSINDVPLQYTLTSADSIGSDDVKKNWSDANKEAELRLNDIHARLRELDKTAPTIRQADSMKIDYAGALRPVTDSLSKNEKAVGKIQHDHRWNGSDKQVQDASNDATQILSRVASESMDVMPRVYETARVTSHATMDAITRSDECVQLTGGDFSGDDQNIVVQDIVQLRRLIGDQHEKIAVSVAQLSWLEHAGAGDTETIRRSIVSAWRRIADSSLSASTAYDSWSINDKADERERGATQKALDEIKLREGQQAAKKLHSVASSLADKIEQADVNNVSDVIQAESNNVSSAQIHEARWATRALILLPSATQATADVMKRDDDARHGELDKTTARRFVTTIQEWSHVSDAVNELLTTLRAMSDNSTIIGAARPQLADKLDHIRQVSHDAAARSHMLHDPKKAHTVLTEFESHAQQAHDSIMTATTADDISNAINLVLNNREALTRWVTDSMSAMHANPATREFIDKKLPKK